MNVTKKVHRRRLPFWRTVIDAYVVTYDNLGYLARISWAWVLLMIPLSLAFYALMFRLGWHQAPEDTFGSIFAFLGSSLLYLPMLASIAVAWHRKLLEDEVWQSAVYLRLDRVVANYIGLALIILFLGLIPFAGFLSRASSIGSMDEVPVAGLIGLGCLILTGVGIFVATRIWLALPPRALDRADITAKDAWAVTRGSFWRLLWGQVLCIFPPIILLTILVWITVGVDEPEDTTLARYTLQQTLFEFLATFLAAMPTVSFLSLAYRWLVMDSTDELQGADQAPSRTITEN